MLAPTSDVIIIVDVLSFSTSVEIATNQGALVYPYPWRDQGAYEFARSVSAEVADKTNKNGYCLSPASLRELPSDIRLVLPSPNGSALSLMTGHTKTIAGCLRNCRAVAESAMRKGRSISIIPAGERWEDGTLRPCFEDLAGAGGIISFLAGRPSPEAESAVAVFERASSNLLKHIKECGSGKEKIERGEEDDLRLAVEVNVSECVPILARGAFEKEA